VFEEASYLSNPYVKFWWIESTRRDENGKPKAIYKVSQREHGEFACSCPAWIYQRTKLGGVCKHILAVMDSIQRGVSELHIQVCEVDHPLMIKVLKKIGEWCDRISAGEGSGLKIMDLWDEVKAARAVLKPDDWQRLEGEFMACQAFATRRQK
jgi:hypothetical protein